MKIIFICGSLEPGRDGVGDYVRRLALELTKAGHESAGIAVNDPFVNKSSPGMQAADGYSLPVLRIPENHLGSGSAKEIISWITNFDPDILSLQFVPFAYHRKGLPLGLSKKLRMIGAGRKWHIMIHELWIGMGRQSPLKDICWGMIQKKAIKSMIARLGPECLHTQTKLYQSHLLKLGFRSDLLPLFSNIPKIKNDSSSMHVLEAANGKLSFVLFGHIHPGAPVKAFVKEVLTYSKVKSVTASLVVIGRSGNALNEWVAVWKTEGLEVNVLGETSATTISEVLRNSTFGIATTPASLIEKSGTVAAMREHELPCICVARPWIPRNVKQPFVPSHVFEYRPGNFANCLQLPKTTGTSNSVTEVARLFIQQFSK